MGNITSIQIRKSTKSKLDSLKLSKRESYNDVIENLIEDSQQLSDDTLREIQLRLTEYEKGEYLTAEQVKRQLGL